MQTKTSKKPTDKLYKPGWVTVDRCIQLIITSTKKNFLFFFERYDRYVLPFSLNLFVFLVAIIQRIDKIEEYMTAGRIVVCQYKEFDRVEYIPISKDSWINIVYRGSVRKLSWSTLKPVPLFFNAYFWAQDWFQCFEDTQCRHHWLLLTSVLISTKTIDGIDNFSKMFEKFWRNILERITDWLVIFATG